MKDGTIAETGTHKNMMGKKGEYTKLYDSSAMAEHVFFTIRRFPILFGITSCVNLLEFRVPAFKLYQSIYLHSAFTPQFSVSTTARFLLFWGQRSLDLLVACHMIYFNGSIERGNTFVSAKFLVWMRIKIQLMMSFNS